MSVKHMGAVFDIPAAELPATQRLVLLALADSANSDTGVTWVAIESRRENKRDLIKKTALGVRAVQNAIKWLEANGHLTRVERPGKGVIYTVHPGARPPHDMHPAPGAPPHIKTPTPAPDAGKPLGTVILEGESAGAPASARTVQDMVADILAMGVTSEQWADFAAMRAAQRSPLTDGAVKLTHRDLVKLAAAGHQPGAVLEQSTQRGWVGVFPVKDSSNDHHGNGHQVAPANNAMVAAAIERRGAPGDRK